MYVKLFEECKEGRKEGKWEGGTLSFRVEWFHVPGVSRLPSKGAWGPLGQMEPLWTQGGSHTRSPDSLAAAAGEPHKAVWAHSPFATDTSGTCSEKRHRLWPGGHRRVHSRARINSQEAEQETRLGPTLTP